MKIFNLILFNKLDLMSTIPFKQDDVTVKF